MLERHVAEESITYDLRVDVKFDRKRWLIVGAHGLGSEFLYQFHCLRNSSTVCRIKDRGHLRKQRNDCSKADCFQFVFRARTCLNYWSRFSLFSHYKYRSRRSRASAGSFAAAGRALGLCGKAVGGTQCGPHSLQHLHQYFGIYLDMNGKIRKNSFRGAESCNGENIYFFCTKSSQTEKSSTSIGNEF